MLINIRYAIHIHERVEQHSVDDDTDVCFHKSILSRMEQVSSRMKKGEKEVIYV